MMRRVTMLSIAALILLHPTSHAQAGLFGSSRSPDDADDRASTRSARDYDRDLDRGDDPTPRDDDAPRSPHGMRSSPVASRSRASADDADAPPPRSSYGRDTGPDYGDTGGRDSYREPAARTAPRDDALPRSSRRQAEASSEGSLEKENAKFDKKMQDLHRQLEEAEQAENARKIKATKWMIQKEEERHEAAAQGASQGSGRRTAKAARSTGPSYEPPPDRAPEERASDDRGARYGDDRRASARRSDDDDRPSRSPSRLASADRGDDGVSNPLKERSRRQQGGDSHSRARDDDDQDDSGRSRGNRFSNAARVAEADGSIRHLY